MHPRNERPDKTNCPECDGTTYRLIGGNITRVSYPDGTTNRFAGVREQRKLLRAERKARKNRDYDELGRIGREKKHIAEKSPKQVSNIIKAHDPE
jgi:hypothetical protein